jgi:S-DNA-T family DNA segregation ATPase FtsK/SpoIIIE
LLARLLRALLRALTGLWTIAARVVGAAARQVGHRARELDPAHRRDGLGLAVLAAALVVAGAVWWHLSGPVGSVVVAVFRGALGAGAPFVPLVLAALAWRLLRRAPDPASRGRLLVGWSAFLFGALGVVHLAKGTPLPPDGDDGMRAAGGLIGFFGSAPLSSAVGPVLASAVLTLLALFGVLVITATPVNAVPARLLALRDRMLRRAPAAEAPAEDESDQPPVRRRPARRRVGVAADPVDVAAGVDPAEATAPPTGPPPPPPQHTPAPRGSEQLPLSAAGAGGYVLPPAGCCARARRTRRAAWSPTR